ncbi:MAG: hypothetical protein R6U68_07080 [Desulfobacteraceae bacterium]
MNQIYQNQDQIDKIGHILEPLIRRVIREELSRIIKSAQIFIHKIVCSKKD